MSIRQKNQKLASAVPEEKEGLLVDLLALKDPLGIQDLHLMEIRGGGSIETVDGINLKRKYLLPLMVR